MLNILKKLFIRPPDFVISQNGKDYMRRWWITPRWNTLPRVYLHHIISSDDDRALHDHISWSLSFLLTGGYVEHYPGMVMKFRRRGNLVFRSSTQAHRLQLYKEYGTHGNEVAVWTIFVVGPKKREWGFHCEKGWRSWREFIGLPYGEATGNEMGPGCD